MAKESNYSKRELDHYFGDIKQTLEKQNVILEEIKTQTIKTNGRVTKSEDAIFVLQEDRSQRRKDLIWAVGIVLTITIFLFNYFK